MKNKFSNLNSYPLSDGVAERKSLEGLTPQIKKNVIQEVNQVLTNKKNNVSLKSKNNQQEFIDKAIADRKLLEKDRGICRDISNPLYLSFLAGFF
jgi:hypothetical protein